MLPPQPSWSMPSCVRWHFLLVQVAEKYPTMCASFLKGLPLRVLGEMEVPTRVVAQVRGPSYGLGV